MSILKTTIIVIMLIGCKIKDTSPNETASSKLNEKKVVSSFNPDGYYFIKKELRIRKLHFERLQIWNNALDSVTLRLTIGKKGKWIDIPSKQHYIEKDSTSIYFSDPTAGNIIITGKFTGNKGPFEDNVIAHEMTVFKGNLKTDDKNYAIEMTWWEGD